MANRQGTTVLHAVIAVAADWNFYATREDLSETRKLSTAVTAATNTSSTQWNSI